MAHKAHQIKWAVAAANLCLPATPVKREEREIGPLLCPPASRKTMTARGIVSLRHLLNGPRRAPRAAGQGLPLSASYATAQVDVTASDRECFLTTAGPIAIINLNRPSRRNALGHTMLAQLGQVIDRIRAQSGPVALGAPPPAALHGTNTLDSSRDDGGPPISVVILKSLVPACFSAGADLKEREEMAEGDIGPFVTRLREAFSSLAALPMPTIAAIDGLAMGGGLEMALACDLRYVGRTSAVKVGLPETRLAIIPAAGGSQRLARLIGTPRAKELILTGAILSGEQAFAYGIANGIASGASLESAPPRGPPAAGAQLDALMDHPDAISCAMAVAGQIASGGPLAVAAAKMAIDGGVQQPLL